MSTKTISSREFNQDAGGAKKAAEAGPVIITDRGKPAHVLMTFATYSELVGRGPSLLDIVAQRDGGDFEFEPEPMEFRPKDVEFD
ncbi:MAG: type II toxin-antitoxin system Phd/YefM family antitoxin [Hyphomonadaceae bacterium]|nr:type II toxin-antitoxin system Phd/YefM family antitoxin [Hyphomonadaceae bacterium]